MKAIILFLVLINSYAVFSYEEPITQCVGDNCCCEEGIILAAKQNCSNSAIRLKECNGTRYLITNAILNGTNISSKDYPNWTITKNDFQYCIGRMYEDEEKKDLGTIPVAFVCFEGEYHYVTTAFGVLEIISVIFLVITLAVYAALPKLRDLYGKCYMCMCLSLALGFLGQGIMQMDIIEITSDAFCSFSGLFVSTWTLASFFWMNVICINTYGSILNAKYMKSAEKKLFLWSCCYAWGGTLIYLIILIIADNVEGDHFKPGITEECWFNDTNIFIFYYGPMALLIALNVILFILSSYKLWRQHDVKNFNNLKYKIILTLKLFLVMGITWIFEIISFVRNSSHVIWTIMDAVNCLQGVVIFLVLVVFRKRVILELFKGNCCSAVTRRLAKKLSPYDDSDDQETLEENTEIHEIGQN